VAAGGSPRTIGSRVIVSTRTESLCWVYSLAEGKIRIRTISRHNIRTVPSAARVHRAGLLPGIHPSTSDCVSAQTDVATVGLPAATCTTLIEGPGTLGVDRGVQIEGNDGARPLALEVLG
jgi:hypothetical protein